MKIQVKMTARDIFDFSMYSAYSGFAGIFTFVFLILVIGILGYAWSSVAVMQRVMLLGCIILFVFVQPIMIWMKAKAHAKTTGYSTPINLDVSDEQIGVEQAGVTGELKWDQIWKVGSRICISSRSDRQTDILCHSGPLKGESRSLLISASGIFRRRRRKD